MTKHGLATFDADLLRRLEQEEARRSEAHQRNDAVAEAKALHMIGLLRQMSGDHAGCLAALDSAIDVAGRGTDDAVLAGILVTRAGRHGPAESARALEDCTRAAEIFRRLRDPAGYANAALARARIEERSRNLVAAADSVSAALEALRGAGTPRPLVQGLVRAAQFETRRKRLIEADALLSEADAVYARSDLPPGERLRIRNAQLIVAADRQQIARALKLVSQVVLGTIRETAGKRVLSLRSALHLASRLRRGGGRKGIEEKRVLEDLAAAKTILPPAAAEHLFKDEDDEAPS